MTFSFLSFQIVHYSESNSHTRYEVRECAIVAGNDLDAEILVIMEEKHELTKDQYSGGDTTVLWK